MANILKNSVISLQLPKLQNCVRHFFQNGIKHRNNKENTVFLQNLLKLKKLK